MSTPNSLDSYWEIVPINYDFVPSKKAQDLAGSELKKILSNNEECVNWKSEFVHVIGRFNLNNQKSICPCCGKEDVVPSGDVFSLSEMLTVEPADEIEVTTPCCNSEIKLASIDFSPHVRFARFGITVRNRIKKIDDKTLNMLGEILGSPMTQIYIDEDV